MGKPNLNRVWLKVYAQFQSAGDGGTFGWDDIEGMTGRDRMASRAAITRARQELELVDGLTIVAQDKEGLTLGRVPG